MKQIPLQRNVQNGEINLHWLYNRILIIKVNLEFPVNFFRFRLSLDVIHHLEFLKIINSLIDERYFYET